jgi:hypothetical protein
MSVRLFVALYLLEAGIFFAIVPWTRVWAVNPLLHHDIAIGMWADNPFVRGFISGFGLIHLMIGIRDIVAVARERRAADGE